MLHRISAKIQERIVFEVSHKSQSTPNHLYRNLNKSIINSYKNRNHTVSFVVMITRQRDRNT